MYEEQDCSDERNVVSQKMFSFVTAAVLTRVELNAEPSSNVITFYKQHTTGATGARRRRKRNTDSAQTRAAHGRYKSTFLPGY